MTESAKPLGYHDGVIFGLELAAQFMADQKELFKDIHEMPDVYWDLALKILELRKPWQQVKPESSTPVSS